jgi:hypothetical protein
LIRYLFTAAATAAISFGIMSATSSAHSQAHSYRAVVGDRVAFPGVDLGCSLSRHTPTISGDPGPLLICSRLQGNSRTILTTRFHYFVTAEDGSLDYTYSRAP